MKKILVILAGFMISCTSQATNTESNTETGVESDQIQMKKSQNKVIKKSIEKTDYATLITEYDQQGKLIKLTDKETANGNSIEFTLKNGKILSAKTSGPFFSDGWIIEQKNTAIYYNEGWEIEVELNEFGYKKEDYRGDFSGPTFNYEYNKDGLLVKMVEIEEDHYAGSSIKTTTTYTYDVMNRDWTKRTGTDNEGNKIVTTRTVEYW